MASACLLYLILKTEAELRTAEKHNKFVLNLRRTQAAMTSVAESFGLTKAHN